MNGECRVVLLILLLLICGIDTSNAEVASFGYENTIDGYINSSSPDTNDFSGLLNIKNFNYSSTGKNVHYQSLIRFDKIFGYRDNQILPGSRINSAYFTWHKYYDSSNRAADAGMYRMLVDWNVSITWNSMESGISIGSEAKITPDGWILANDDLEGSIDVTQTVQDWSDGENNFGWVFDVELGADNNLGLVSSDSEDVKYNRFPTLTVNYQPPPLPSQGAILFEDFEERGSYWDNTIFPIVFHVIGYGNSIFAKDILISAIGAPDTMPPIPINSHGDKEGKFYMLDPPENGLATAIALTDTINAGANMSIDGYIGFGILDSGTTYGGFLLRGSGVRSSEFSGYSIDVYYEPVNKAIIYIRQVRDGLARDDYPYEQSIVFPIDFKSSNIHLKTSVIGRKISASAWVVFEENGIVIESPIQLTTTGSDKYTITLVDDTFAYGLGGIEASISSSNSVFFDDITVNTKVRKKDIAPIIMLLLNE